eukprot:IDg14730t1
MPGLPIGLKGFVNSSISSSSRMALIKNAFCSGAYLRCGDRYSCDLFLSLMARGATRAGRSGLSLILNTSRFVFVFWDFATKPGSNNI